MIMSNHLCDKNQLMYKTKDECLLTCRVNFTASKDVMINIGRDQDGSYIVYDTIRQQFNRAGAAESVQVKR